MKTRKIYFKAESKTGFSLKEGRNFIVRWAVVCRWHKQNDMTWKASKWRVEKEVLRKKEGGFSENQKMSYYIFFIVHFCQHVHGAVYMAIVAFPSSPFSFQILGIFARKFCVCTRSRYARGKTLIWNFPHLWMCTYIN